jgi:hypothetical protein
MTSPEKVTPRPWAENGTAIESAERYVASVNSAGQNDEAEDDANRALIVLAVNNLEALRDAVYNGRFFAVRLLHECEEANGCGDHCRNSCRWCGLRNFVMQADEVLARVQK